MIGLTAPFIAVTGTIGTGKSTLVRKVGEAFSLPTFPELVESSPYFGPSEKLALQIELWFLNASLRACREASGHQGGVVERLPAEHLEVFARYRHNQGWLVQGEMGLLEATYAASGGSRAGLTWSFTSNLERSRRSPGSGAAGAWASRTSTSPTCRHWSRSMCPSYGGSPVLRSYASTPTSSTSMTCRIWISFSPTSGLDWPASCR
jgi:hypothetical protein